MPTLRTGCTGSRDDGRSRFIRDGLEGRTIFLPKSFLERYDTRPGQLTELLTLSLSSYLQREGGVA